MQLLVFFLFGREETLVVFFQCGTNTQAHKHTHMHLHAIVARVMGFVNFSVSLATLAHLSYLGERKH
jgi:hypothetical protein